MRILCVAEKPSIAKSITEILSAGNGYANRPGSDKYCRNFSFQYRMPPGAVLGAGSFVDMTITSVRGHLTSIDFRETHRKWYSCDPSALFDAPIDVNISDDARQIANNLRSEAKNADALMIWTDCDREGEHIGAEVVRECQKAKRNIIVKRARFSAIIANQIHRACQQPVDLDWRAASAVEARQELDLRIGAAFTRLQTMRLQNQYRELTGVLSYGPCQFPTLGFVVEQYIKVCEFVPEPFWYLQVQHKRDRVDVNFKWNKNHLFDRDAVAVLLQRLLASPLARVTKVTSKQTRKFKPRPLTTVELQKSASRLLHMAPKRILDIAESLYQKGMLSYPRTETDQYDAAFDFHTLINKQRADGDWGGFAARLSDGAFERPRDGNKNDKAHPPIHPTSHATGLSGDDKRVYEYVTRRFLASCSTDALGKETVVEIEVAGEGFKATGLVVQQRNFLEVFPYEKWGTAELPEYTQGESFKPDQILMREGETTSPKLLTEADLVSLMDRNGIGTDATIAEHISKIIERNYVMTTFEGRTKYLIPSTLGMGLVEGYNKINFEGDKSLSKPQLRREMEQRMDLICNGQRTKQDTIQESVAEYRAVFAAAHANLQRVSESVGKYLRGEFDVEDMGGGGGEGGGDGDGNGGGGGRGGGPGGGGGGVGGVGPSRRPASGRRDDTPDVKTDVKPDVKPSSGPAAASIDLDDIDAFFDDDDDIIFLDSPPAAASAAGPSSRPAAARAKPAPSNAGAAAAARPTTSRAAPRAGPSVSTAIPSKRKSASVEYDEDEEEAAFGSRAKAGRSNTAPSGGGDILCRCSEPAVLLTVQKEGGNKGRRFWACAKPRENGSCGFFSWDEGGAGGGGGGASSFASGSRPAVQSSMERYRHQVSSRGNAARQVVRCLCGLEARTDVVRKEGPNTGRSFHGCPKESRVAQCNFFEWVDEKDGAGVDGGSSFGNGGVGGSNGRGSTRTGSSGKCFKCDQEGHWSSDCPNPDGGGGGTGSRRGTKRATGTGARGGVAKGKKRGGSTSAKRGAGGKASSMCFKCEEVGHWASECPNGDGGGNGAGGEEDDPDWCGD